MRRLVTSRFISPITCPRDGKTAEDNRRYEAGHQRALLTLDFLIQLKARAREGGGACRSHVEQVRSVKTDINGRFTRRRKKLK